MTVWPWKTEYIWRNWCSSQNLEITKRAWIGQVSLEQELNSALSQTQLKEAIHMPSTRLRVPCLLFAYPGLGEGLHYMSTMSPVAGGWLPSGEIKTLLLKDESMLSSQTSEQVSAGVLLMKAVHPQTLKTKRNVMSFLILCPAPAQRNANNQVDISATDLAFGKTQNDCLPCILYYCNFLYYRDNF